MQQVPGSVLGRHQAQGVPLWHRHGKTTTKQLPDSFLGNEAAYRLSAGACGCQGPCHASSCKALELGGLKCGGYPVHSITKDGPRDPSLPSTVQVAHLLLHHHGIVVTIARPVCAVHATPHDVTIIPSHSIPPPSSMLLHQQPCPAQLQGSKHSAG